MSTHDVIMESPRLAGEDLRASSATPQMKPAREVTDPWGALISSQEQALKEGTMNAMQTIPASPLASVIAAASPSAYQAMTAPVPGANPEAPNMLAGLDNLMLGGLIESPLARGLMRVNAPNMKAAAPARLRGKLFDPQGESGPTFYSQARAVVEDPRLNQRPESHPQKKPFQGRP